MDKIKMMQRKLKKYIDEKEQGYTSASTADAKPTGLLSRRPSSTDSSEKMTGTQQKDNERIIADYIVKIRKYKEELLNGK